MADRRSPSRREWLGVCAGTTGITMLAGCSSADETDDEDTDSSDGGVLEFDDDSSGDWPMFGADLQNTGYQPDGDGPVEDVEVRWRLEGGDSFVSSPAVVDGTVYAGCRDGYLYAVDAETGSTEWAVELNKRITPPPTVIDGIVYVSSHGVPNKLHALEADSGEQLWEEELENTTQTPVPYGDNLYVFYPGWLLSIDRKSGESSVLFKDYGRTPDLPAIADGMVFGGGSHSFVAYNIERQELKWEFENENSDFMSEATPAISNETVYVGSGDTKLYAIDIQDGGEKWSFKTERPISAGPSIVDDNVYLPARDGHVYSIDKDTGEEEWSTDYELRLQQKPVVTDNMIYFVDGKTLHGLNRDDGGQQWSFTPDEDETIGGTVAVSDGVIYLPSRDHHLYALEES
ncbi:PQQ-binding-like beta-propeller repeat protein [Natrarchaeobius sp. A-rgal3]|uniref:outer membrane protein assembly factor BamB family protein n=1 Tax=Natrarchaeobius versutus TaxID=1679078 RepID=UPI00350EF49B